PVLAADRIDQSGRRKHEQQKRERPHRTLDLGERHPGEDGEKPEGPQCKRRKIRKLRQWPEGQQSKERVTPVVRRQRLTEFRANRPVIGWEIEQGPKLIAEREARPHPDIDEIAPERVTDHVESVTG